MSIGRMSQSTLCIFVSVLVIVNQTRSLRHAPRLANEALLLRTIIYDYERANAEWITFPREIRAT